MKHLIPLVLFALMCAWPPDASAFCGMYVSGDASAKMYNDATQVFLMRHGTRTVVTMRNRYDGPAQDFAMLVPVPQVLKKGQVKTLKHEVFQRVQTFTAPRLVTYTEGRCDTQTMFYNFDDVSIQGALAPSVRVVSRFKVGEYDVAILSAKESTGLSTWLHAHGFKLPKKAKSVLNAYIQQGMYFFVAKVDPKRVLKDGGRPVLSPLRFHYDSKNLTLPIRLGLLQSKKDQDLLIHVLTDKRQELANRPNVFIPTNLEVHPGVARNFASFYEALFDHVARQNPGAAITEYAWTLGSAPKPPGVLSSLKCDPCPPAPSQPTHQDFLGLGADLMRSSARESFLKNAVLTRLHLRFLPSQAPTDLIFRSAHTMEGGVGTPKGDAGASEVMVRKAASPRFQARYMLLTHTKDSEGAGIWDQCRVTSFFSTSSRRVSKSALPRLILTKNVLGLAFTQKR